jgi:hypothetical protein
MADRAAVAARRERVLQLRRTGLSFSAIGRDTHQSAKAAAQDLRRALAAQRDLLELAEAPFTPVLEGERLDAWQRHLEAVLANSAAAGDHSMVIRAAGRLLELQRCRLALAGIEVEPSGQPDEIDLLAAKARLRLVAAPEA